MSDDTKRPVAPTLADVPRADVPVADAAGDERSTPESGPDDAPTLDTGVSGTRTQPSGVSGVRPKAGYAAVLPDRYEDRGEIGRGGSSEVRRVFDRHLEREVVLKVLGWKHLTPPQNPTRRRFQNEARITAALAHPGVVPVHDRGVLEDGRPWFTMKEVRGETFEEVIASVYRGPRESLPGRRRSLVEALLRVAETVGYAHSRGVVHRDLKPENLMRGAFGEVYVMDWGIARVMGEAAPDETPIPAGGKPRLDNDERAMTRSGEIFGTIRYMAPEQARGHTEAVGPASDVWALGLVLYEILVGDVAYDGPGMSVWAELVAGARPTLPSHATVPGELRELFEAATCADTSARLPDGSAFAERLRSWLAGEARREKAAQVLREVDAKQAALETLRAEEAELRNDAQAMLGKLRDDSPDEERIPAWRAEDAADAKREALEEAEAEVLELLRAALQHDPESARAHARIAELAKDEVVAAEQRGDRRDAWRWERLLRQHDTGQHAGFLAGLGTLALDSTPSGAAVTIHRYEELDRRLQTRVFRAGLTTPFELTLPAGSYLVVLEAPGHETVRYPVRIEREGTWNTTPPGENAPRPVWLPEEGTVGPGACFVPAGWSVVGAPGGALDAYARTEIWLEDFIIQQNPVTVAAYMEFLRDLLKHGELERTRAMIPQAGTDRQYVWVDGSSVRAGRLANQVDTLEVLRAPVRWVSVGQARGYAGWLSRRASNEWRLPCDYEWEKAGRGVDERRFPWGATPVASWVVSRGYSPPGVRPVDDPTFDLSPYGVRHLSGNVREFCSNAWRPRPVLGRDGSLLFYDSTEQREFVSVRGGSYLDAINQEMLAARYAVSPSEALRLLGFRLVRSVTLADAD
ncbi:MAG: SUMF1/EgtB/PvdO family nonheme iron enzyme [Myxococcota bacterium]